MKKKSKYITVLDFETGRVFQYKVKDKFIGKKNMPEETMKQNFMK